MSEELDTSVESGTDEPVYDLPAGVGSSDPSDASGTSEPPAEPAADLPQAAADADAPAPPPAADEPADPVLSHPAVQAIVATLERQNAALQQALLRQQAPQADAAPPAPETPRPEEDVELETRMLERIPFLRQVRDLVQSPTYQHLLGMAERAPHFNETINQFSDDVATRARELLVSGYAERRGLEATSLAREDTNALIDTFIGRLSKDPARQARFNAGDLRVVDEVMSREYERWGLAAPAAAPPAEPVVQPATQSAAIAARAAGARNLPRSAGNALPPPAGAPVVNSDDEDAVHGAAWRALQGTRATQ